MRLTDYKGMKKNKIYIEKNFDIVKKERGYAVFSFDKKYRYILGRKWSNKGKCLFILLNPSTADAFKLDPTITRAYNLSKKLGLGELIILNIFAIRGSNPEIIKKVSDPIGPLNNYYIKKYVKKSDLIILGWGNHGKINNRSKEIIDIIKKVKKEIYVLDINKNGEPKHPLYIKSDIKIKKYNILHNN